MTRPYPSAPTDFGERYPRALRILHWSLALTLALQVVLILVFRQLLSVQFANIVLGLHRSCGTAIWLLIVARLAVGVRLRPPKAKADTPKWQAAAAALVHGALIVAVVAQPLVGVLWSWARGDEVMVLGILKLPQLVTPNDAQGSILKELHRGIAYGLFGLIAVHLGAVLFNSWVRKVPLASRMLSRPPANRFNNRVPLTVQLTVTCGIILVLSAGAGLYGASQYQQYGEARDRFDDGAVSTLDDMRVTQLDLRALAQKLGDRVPAAARAHVVAKVARLATEMDGYRLHAANADIRAAAAKTESATQQLAGGLPTKTDLVKVDELFQDVVDNQTNVVVQGRLEIREVAAKGHDLIVLVLAPAVLTGAILALLLSRSVLIALSRARAVVRGVEAGADGEDILVVGRGEFAQLMRDTVRMRDTVQARQHEATARQMEVQAQAAHERLAKEVAEAANQALTESQEAIRNLLDNADQGFLTVGRDLLVGDQFSAACETILGQTPAGHSIIALLFPAGGERAEGMQLTLDSMFGDANDFTRDLKLELLPKEFTLGETFITAAYKLVADDRLMLILTDVTETRRLTVEVGRERQRLEMIVLAITEADTFAALSGDYRRFLDEELPALVERFDDPAAPDELYRRLHTFKGLLAQFSFPESPAALHDAETSLAARETWSAALAAETFGAEALLAGLQRDLSGVTDVLGPDFAASGRHLVLSQSQLQAMEQVARAVLMGAEGRTLSPPLRLLLQTLADLGMLDVKAALALHSRGAPALADRLEKQLAPIAVVGDDVALPPETYGEFFRSLVHLFRNAVDHGIETPEDRLEAGKPMEGAIRCEVRDLGEHVEILIEDDGRGVDRQALEARMAALGEAAGSIEAMSLEDLVFRQGLSSRDTVSSVSGRGVGLAAVKTELNRLGGSVTVTSRPGQGAQFRFHLPTDRSGFARGAVEVQRTA